MKRAAAPLRVVNLADFLAREGPWQQVSESLNLALAGLIGNVPLLFLRNHEEADSYTPEGSLSPEHEAAARQVLATGRIFHSREAGVLAVPVPVGKEVAGALLAASPGEHAEHSVEPRFLLQVLALLVGRSLESTRLQLLLQSRLLQLAVPGSSPRSSGAAFPEPEKVARLVAKSFYQEMTRAGFTSERIIEAATEILSQLGEKVKRHSRRRSRPGQAGPS